MSSRWKSSIVASTALPPHIRMGFRLLRRFELQDHYPCCKPLDFVQIELPPCLLVREKACALAQDDRVHHQAIEVDQVLAHHGVEELPAAREQQVLSGLLLK